MTANDNTPTTDQPRRAFRVDYFGGCPTCGVHDGALSVGPDHWFVCHMHRVKWSGGSNVFDSWKEQDAMTFRINAVKLSRYAEVKPLAEGDVVLSSDPEIQRRQAEAQQETELWERERDQWPEEAPF